jgi:hypothetical protein
MEHWVPWTSSTPQRATHDWYYASFLNSLDRSCKEVGNWYIKEVFRLSYGQEKSLEDTKASVCSNRREYHQSQINCAFNTHWFCPAGLLEWRERLSDERGRARLLFFLATSEAQHFGTGTRALWFASVSDWVTRIRSGNWNENICISSKMLRQVECAGRIEWWSQYPGSHQVRMNCGGNPQRCCQTIDESWDRETSIDKSIREPRLRLNLQSPEADHSVRHHKATTLCNCPERLAVP